MKLMLIFLVILVGCNGVSLGEPKKLYYLRVGETIINKFKDKGNVCYIATSAYTQRAVGISCVKGEEE